MTEPDKPLRVGFYGVGRFAQETHIPNIQALANVEVAALCDLNEQALSALAEEIGLHTSHTYTDAHSMLAEEELDILFSCVPAYARTDVEIAAVHQGIHLYSEKPQAVDMARARAIAEAIQGTGVLSTVGFRERCRPSFQQVRQFLADKDVIHVRCAVTRPDFSAREKEWLYYEDKSGGFALEWGIHAVDYIRYMTGLNVSHAQAFYCRRADHEQSLSYSFNFRLENGGSMSMAFVTYLAQENVAPGQRHVPLFTIYYVGGRLDIYREGKMQWTVEKNGRPLVQQEEFDPWLAHDRLFVEAVRSGRGGRLTNDYHDGLFTLAPVLAGWRSAQQDGVLIDVEAFRQAGE